MFDSLDVHHVEGYEKHLKNQPYVSLVYMAGIRVNSE